MPDRQNRAPTVGVVIRSFNEEQHIGRLLTGIAHQTRPPEEIVLVDSGSTDATVEIASRFGVKICQIAPEDFSFGRALNLGCSLVESDVIVMASAHVYPTHDTWLERLVAPFTNEQVALTYGRQVGDERTRFSEHQLLLRWFPVQSVEIQADAFCNNANAAIRRILWETLRYDEDLTGLEDLHWSRRALDKGYVLSYVAEAMVVHVHQENWSRLRNRYRREAIAHKRIFEEHRLGWVEAIRLGLTHTLSDYRAAARERVVLRNLASIPAFHSAQFIGAYQGFAQEGEASSELKRRFYYPRTDLAAEAADEQIGRRIDYSKTENVGD